MNISSYNLGIYSSMMPFKGSSMSAGKKKTMGVENELPNPQLYADCDNWNYPTKKKEELIADYKSKLKNIIFDADKNIDKRIVDFLDNQKFEIETSTPGVKVPMTIKEAINASIKEVNDFDSYLYHATAWKEIGDEIIRTGFDPDKISRTKLGPGFYFSGSEGGAREYSSSVLRADCKGKCANVEAAYFEKITDAGVISAIKDFIGINNAGYAVNTAAYEFCSKILNEYARQYLVNDLGIDMAYGASGRFETCFAVYNPNSISNIRHN
ncbi:hypothetical protein IJD44_08760 [bacterium]|nr:hypothetical protein [bacterium]